jgi:hypothetical protein
MSDVPHRTKKSTQAYTPVYELFENSATNHVLVSTNGKYHVANDGNCGSLVVANRDGVKCIWRCPKCKRAMTIGKCVKVSFDNVLTVPLTCTKCREPEDKTL